MTQYSLFAVHESRYLMQARPFGQYVDLQHQKMLTTPSWTFISLTQKLLLSRFVKKFLAYFLSIFKAIIAKFKRTNPIIILVT